MSDDVRQAFRMQARGGIRLDDLTVTSDRRIVVRGIFADGIQVSAETEPVQGSLLERAGQFADELIDRHRSDLHGAFEAHVERIKAGQIIAREIIDGRKAKAELARMGKLQQFATRAPEVIRALEGRVDQLAPRLDAVEKRGNAAFDRWSSHLDVQEGAISEAENAINQLSNGAPPLDGSSTGSGQ